MQSYRSLTLLIILYTLTNNSYSLKLFNSTYRYLDGYGHDSGKFSNEANIFLGGDNIIVHRLPENHHASGDSIGRSLPSNFLENEADQIIPTSDSKTIYAPSQYLHRMPLNEFSNYFQDGLRQKNIMDINDNNGLNSPSNSTIVADDNQVILYFLPKSTFEAHMNLLYPNILFYSNNGPIFNGIECDQNLHVNRDLLENCTPVSLPISERIYTVNKFPDIQPSEYYKTFILNGNEIHQLDNQLDENSRKNLQLWYLYTKTSGSKKDLMDYEMPEEANITHLRFYIPATIHTREFPFRLFLNGKFFSDKNLNCKPILPPQKKTNKAHSFTRIREIITRFFRRFHDTPQPHMDTEVDPEYECFYELTLPQRFDQNSFQVALLYKYPPDLSKSYSGTHISKSQLHKPVKAYLLETQNNGEIINASSLTGWSHFFYNYATPEHRSDKIEPIIIKDLEGVKDHFSNLAKFPKNRKNDEPITQSFVIDFKLEDKPIKNELLLLHNAPYEGNFQYQMVNINKYCIELGKVPWKRIKHHGLTMDIFELPDACPILTSNIVTLVTINEFSDPTYLALLKITYPNVKRSENFQKINERKQKRMNPVILWLSAFSFFVATIVITSNFFMSYT